MVLPVGLEGGVVTAEKRKSEMSTEPWGEWERQVLSVGRVGWMEGEVRLGERLGSERGLGDGERRKAGILRPT